MKYIFGTLCILLVGVMIYGVQKQQQEPKAENAQTEAQSKTAKVIKNQHHDPAIKLLQDKCFKCHGAVKNGRKKIKGKFDMSLVMENGKLIDSPEWTKVVEQIESGQMPPEDSKAELSVSERKSVVDMLNESFTSKTLPKRRVSPFEFTYSMPQVFGYDAESFDPFGRMRFSCNPGLVYPTVYSADTMTLDYLKELEFGMDQIVKNHVSHQKYGTHKKHQNINFAMAPIDYALSAAVFFDYKNKTEYTSKAGTRERHMEGLAHTRKQKEIGNKTRFDLRFSRDEFLHPGNPRSLENRNLPAGRYRISFKAVALNRSEVKKAFDKYEKAESARIKAGKPKPRRESWAQKDREQWQGLLHEKARLNFIQAGTQLGGYNKNYTTMRSTVYGKVIKSVEIDDDIPKDYSFEFEIDQRNAIYLNFINAPHGGLGPAHGFIFHLNLNGLRSRDKNGGWSKIMKDYVLPCVRILSEIKVEQLSAAKTKSEYDINLVKDLSEAAAKEKLAKYIKELSLTYNTKLDRIYDKLPDSFSVEEKYKMALKMITMSPDNIFLDFSGKAPDSAARYVSYALLKTHPSQEFKKDYLLFRKGEMTSKAFAKKIVDHPGFEKFLHIFAQGWLEQGTKLDLKKFSSYKRALPFQKETDVYLDHLFTNNRPVKELFDSDYRVLNQELAIHYGIGNPEKLDRYKYSKVKLKENERGGLVNQGNFYISHSSGVDPLPFVRAKWLSENVFNRKISEPPINIDTEEFVSMKNLKTFEERTAAHSQNAACYSCHKILDPIAFAMHNYDTIGNRIEKQNKEAGVQFVKRIAKAEKEMAEAFTGELISYIVGRETTIYDHKMAGQIVKKTAKNNYALRDILAEVIEVYFKK